MLLDHYEPVSVKHMKEFASERQLPSEGGLDLWIEPRAVLLVSEAGGTS